MLYELVRVRPDACPLLSKLHSQSLAKRPGAITCWDITVACTFSFPSRDSCVWKMVANESFSLFFHHSLTHEFDLFHVELSRFPHVDDHVTAAIRNIDNNFVKYIILDILATSIFIQ